MSQRAPKKIVIANWKMNPIALKEAEKLSIHIAKSVLGKKKVEVVLCPPFLYLEKLKKNLKNKKVAFGAQDSFSEKNGAYTGEIASEMLYDIGSRYVILGHSERRSMGETNELINKKIKSALDASLCPVLCIGENKRDENHEFLNFVKKELEECLIGISKNSISKVIIAYEPIWAIGNGAHPATPAEFLEMNIFIRKILSDKFGINYVDGVRIVYGGSVDDKNAEDFIKEGQADGFLVGRASLDPKKFGEIVNICEVSAK
jgi:triosephosphate isomerase